MNNNYLNTQSSLAMKGAGYYSAKTAGAKKAIDKKTGARGLRSIIESLLLKTMFKLPTMTNVEEIVVDKATVKGTSEPLVIYSKNKKTTAA